MREGGKNKYILRAKDYVWTGEACLAAGTIKYSVAGRDYGQDKKAEKE